MTTELQQFDPNSVQNAHGALALNPLNSPQGDALAVTPAANVGGGGAAATADFLGVSKAAPALFASAIDSVHPNSVLSAVDTATPALFASATDGAAPNSSLSAVDTAAPALFASAIDSVHPNSVLSAVDTATPTLFASATDGVGPALLASATDTAHSTDGSAKASAPQLAALHGESYYGDLSLGSIPQDGDFSYDVVMDGIQVTPNGDQTIVSNAGTGMTIAITWDSSVSSAPSLFQTDVLMAAAMFTRSFTNSMTINISVGYGEVNGSTLGSGALGQSLTYLFSYSYSQIRTALAATSSDGFDTSAIASLPATDPIGGTYWLTAAQARALGLSTYSGTDGFVGFSSSAPFAYDVNSRAVGGSYDFIGTVMHELSEVMGRQRIGGGTIGSTSNSYSLEDLFSYSSSGVRSPVGGNTSYFSVDGGVTNLGNFNTVSGGDWGDWASSATNDSGLAFSNSGVANVWMNRDMVSLDVLGYHRAAAVQGDLTNDGTADILLQSNGSVVDWRIGSNSVAGSGLLGAASGWTVVAEGDFNGDGSQDILLTNASGAVVDWSMRNGAVSSGALIGNTSGYTIVGTGDFNGDGTTDILLQNASGNVVDWTMRNGALLGTAVLGNAAGYSVAGIGDFNNDGTADILFQNASGTIVDWMISNNAYSSGHVVGGAAGWTVVGVGDFNGDRTSDILLQNGSGSVVTWNMSNGTYLSGSLIGQGGSYSVVAVGDYNMDGTSDILLRDAGGTVVEWNVSNNTVTRAAAVGGSGSYTVVRT